jgi:hypothetical protein
MRWKSSKVINIYLIFSSYFSVTSAEEFHRAIISSVIFGPGGVFALISTGLPDPMD